MGIQQECIEAYRRHRNLKLAAGDVGISWQMVYVHLRSAGEPVMGDKLKYGSESDKLAAKGEQLFLALVPLAEDQNATLFQSKIDFKVHGYSVDVKTSTLRLSNKGSATRRWAFSVKKQEMLVDFMVCLCIGRDGESLEKLLMVPGEIVRKYSTISLAELGGKWGDYTIPPAELAGFFAALPAKP
jgi:hypothetical protein